MPEKFYTLKIIPNSKLNKIVEAKDNYLKIKLTAPAHENKANTALLEFLSSYFKVAKKNIILTKGQKSRQKIIKITS